MACGNLSHILLLLHFLCNAFNPVDLHSMACGILTAYK